MFCISLQTGDRLQERKWKHYYDIPEDMGDDKVDGVLGHAEPKYGYFVQGSIIGLQLDADRGVLNFYKDGEDLGPAFVTGELRIGNYYPFFRIRTKARLSIFSPKQYPWYYEVPVEPVMPQEPTLEEDFFYT